MSELYFPSLSTSNIGSDSQTSIAELQGALCGLLCLTSEADRMSWYNGLFEDFNPDENEARNLIALFDQTAQSLESPDLDLQLAIPNDNASLSSRLLALAHWCQGLIFGLGASGLTDDTPLSAETKEYINDIISISQIADDNLVNTEENENHFAELTEYIRMGLFLIYGELQASVRHTNMGDGITRH